MKTKKNFWVAFFLGSLAYLLGCGENSGIYSKPKLVWSTAGEEKDENLGFKAAGVGDVTGSGFDALLVGAPGHSQRRGRAYLYLGSSDGLDQKATWVVEGENPGDNFGQVVGALGDLTGSGYMDYFVVAPTYSTPGAFHCGKVYVYLGGPNGPSQKPFWTGVGTSAEELFGDCAASVGDINGDGYPDFMIGSYGFDKFRGKVSLYLGGPHGLSKKPDWVFNGEYQGDWMGYGIGPAGDVNGDGYDDVLLGSKFYSHPSRNLGKVYLFYGSSHGLALKPDWIKVGEAMDSRLGHHLGGAGDVNGHGYSDVVIGAPGYDQARGRAYVYFGSPTGLKDQADAVLEGKIPGESFGTDVNSAEDVESNGHSGILVGGPGYARFPGSSSLYLSSPDGFKTSPAFRQIGETNADGYGSILGSVGDIDGSGTPSWFVCAPNYGGGAGKVYIYQGLETPFPRFRVNLRRKSNGSLVGPGGAFQTGKDTPVLSLAVKDSINEAELQAEVKETGKAFDGNNLITSNWMPVTGSLELTGLQANKAYRWRARLVLKDGTTSHWYYPSFERLTGSPCFRILAASRNP